MACVGSQQRQRRIGVQRLLPRIAANDSTVTSGRAKRHACRAVGLIPRQDRRCRSRRGQHIVFGRISTLILGPVVVLTGRCWERLHHAHTTSCEVTTRRLDRETMSRGAVAARSVRWRTMRTKRTQSANRQLSTRRECSVQRCRQLWDASVTAPRLTAGNRTRPPNQESTERTTRAHRRGWREASTVPLRPSALNNDELTRQPRVSQTNSSEIPRGSAAEAEKVVRSGRRRGVFSAVVLGARFGRACRRAARREVRARIGRGAWGGARR